METIFWISIGLVFIAAIAVGLTVRAHNKMFKDNEDPLSVEDIPGRYDDIEYCERPFMEVL